MSQLLKTERRVYRNIRIDQLRNYRYPPSAIVSILHRISGALLTLLLPFALYLLDRSLTSEMSFEHFKTTTSSPIVKIIVLILMWGYIQHFVGGIRHLFMDLHFGLDKDTTMKTSKVVLAITAVITLAAALKLFGVF